MVWEGGTVTSSQFIFFLIQSNYSCLDTVIPLRSFPGWVAKHVEVQMAKLIMHVKSIKPKMSLRSLILFEKRHIFSIKHTTGCRISLLEDFCLDFSSDPPGGLKGPQAMFYTRLCFVNTPELTLLIISCTGILEIFFFYCQLFFLIKSQKVHWSMGEGFKNIILTYVAPK